MALYEPQTDSGVIRIEKEHSTWYEYIFGADVSLTVLPIGTIPGQTAAFILPASTVTIESQAFIGITNQVFQIPSTVTFIADDAFDSSAIILVEEGSYAEDRCTELGLKVYK